MPCEQIARGVIVCSSPYVRHAMHCETCGRVRPMAGTYGMWYGYMLICIGCGESWYDEGRGFRPFQRGWRKAAIARALAMWSKANPMRLEAARQHAEWTAAEDQVEAER